MIIRDVECEGTAIQRVGTLMMIAAKTAPKGCGADKIVSIYVDGDEKTRLAMRMREYGKDERQAFFSRDAGNVDGSQGVVLIGAKDIPLGLEPCGLCGFENCMESRKAGSHCTFNVTDLGIAVGSAVSIASDHRVDNRVMYSAGKAALDLGLFEGNVGLCFGVPLSASSKSVFFDRAPGSVMV